MALAGMHMIGKTTKVYGDLERFSGLVLKGRVLSIDPSIGSNSSMPGWAVYDASEYIDSGILLIDIPNSIPDRLQQLHHEMRQLMMKWKPDVLVYEDIPASRFGGGNAVAHASLLKAVGAILAVPGPTGFIGLLPVTWKRFVRNTYIKGDESDAKEIGYIAIKLAAWMEDEKKKRGTRRKRKSADLSVLR